MQARRRKVRGGSRDRISEASKDKCVQEEGAEFPEVG